MTVLPGPSRSLFLSLVFGFIVAAPAGAVTPMPGGPHLFYSDFNGTDSQTFGSGSAYPPEIAITASSNGSLPGGWYAAASGDFGGGDPGILVDGGLLTLIPGSGNFSSGVNVVHCVAGVGVEWTLETLFYPGAISPDRAEFSITNEVAPCYGNAPSFRVVVHVEGLLSINSANFETGATLTSGAPYRMLVTNTATTCNVQIIEDASGTVVMDETGSSGGCLDRISFSSSNYSAGDRQVDWIVIDGSPSVCGEETCFPTDLRPGCIPPLGTPTLSEWGLLVALLLVTGSGVVAVRRFS